MRTLVLVRYSLFIIAVNFFCSSPVIAATEIGTAIESILHVPYAPFASKEDTIEKQAASCVSTVVYGLQAIGYQCPYQNFKAYQSIFNNQSSPLKFGKTKFDEKGLILFSRAHFAALYEDINSNGVIDESDTIIHSLFGPVTVTSISEWLSQDLMRPIKYLRLTPNLQCPMN